MAFTAIRSNGMPAGGQTAVQPIPPTETNAQLQALIDQFTPTIQAFREQSAPESVDVDQVVLTGGTAKSVRLPSVGLGYLIESEHTVVITLDNTAAAAQSVSLSPVFPYNLLANTRVGINGGKDVYSCDGYSGLLVAGRPYVNSLNISSGALSPALVSVTLSAGVTSVAAAPYTSLCGLASISIPASTTATITVAFATFEKLAQSEETLLGALTMQNNSVFAQVTRQLVGSVLGNNPTFPLYVSGGAPATLSATYTDTVNSSYDFWSVPSDPSLYADMISNAYNCLSVPALTAQGTGAQALKYDIPQNELVTALHMIATDTNGDYVDGYNAFPRVQLKYGGGTLTPTTAYARRHRARNLLRYGADVGSLPGYLLWDGNATSDSITSSDEAGWLDTYSASAPQLIADIATSVAAPLTYTVTRESVIVGSVSQVG